MRESAVATAKMAVLIASLRRGGGGGGDSGGTPASGLCVDTEGAIVRAGPAVLRGHFRYGQHPLPEEADPPRRTRASGEPSLHVGGQDVLPPSGEGDRRRRGRDGRDRAPRAGEDGRQGRQEWRAAPQ